MYRKLFYFALASSIILFTGCPSETLNVTQIERPTITSSGGNSFDSNTIISITSEDDASIYYTLDGSNPTSSSTPYSAPFEINDTSTVKAIAMMSGFDDSPIAIQTYTIVDIPNTTFAIKDIAIGSEFTLFLMEDGSLWGCGFNTSGQLGMGDVIRNVLYPTKIIDSGVKSVSAGNSYAMIIKDDNSLWATGHNMKHFGDGSEDDSSTFKFIRDDVRSVSCSFGHTSIITTDGELFSTGYNAEGKPEVGTNIINAFQKVSDNSTSDLIDAQYGSLYCAFLKTSGDLYVSGSNLYSIIGPAAETDYKKDYIPILIAQNVKSFSAGENHIMFIDNNNKLYGLGRMYHGCLGNSYHTDYYDFTFNYNNNAPYYSLDDVKSVVAGDYSSFVIKNDGTFWMTGSDYDNQLGDGDDSTLPHTGFFQIDDHKQDVVDVYSYGNTSFIIDDDGYCYGTGGNSQGQLGIGTMDDGPIDAGKNVFTKISFEEFD